MARRGNAEWLELKKCRANEWSAPLGGQAAATCGISERGQAGRR